MIEGIFMNEDLKEKIDDIWEFVNDCEEKKEV